MPYLFVRPLSGPRDWSVLPLDGQGPGVVLSADPSTPVALRAASRVAGLAALLPFAAADGRSWALLPLSGSPVRVNGFSVDLGIAILRDKDEIVAGDTHAFLSLEVLPEIAPMPRAGAICPRCRKEIPLGSPAVNCPACRRWFHQASSPGFPCWTGYEAEPFPQCMGCPHPPRLGQGFQWTPEGL